VDGQERKVGSRGEGRSQRPGAGLLRREGGELYEDPYLDREGEAQVSARPGQAGRRAEGLARQEDGAGSQEKGQDPRNGPLEG